MGSVSGSIKLCYRNFIRSHLERKFKGRLNHFNQILTNGLNTITMSLPIRAKCVADERQWKRLKTANKSGKKKRWPEFEMTDTFKNR